MVHFRLVFVKAFFDIRKAVLPYRVHIAGVIEPETPGPSGNLADFGGGQRAVVLSVELAGLHEHDPPHRQVQTHADGVRGHHDACLPLGEKLNLPAPDLRGKASVDHADLDAAALQPPGDVQHHPFGEHNQGIPFLHVIGEGKGLILAEQSCLALISVHLEGIPAQGDQVGDDLLCRSAHADMDFLRLHAQDGPGPGVPSVGIGNHLGFIDDGNVIFLVQVQHLHRGGDDAAVLLIDALFPGEHAAGNLGFLHLLVDFQGQQAQGSQVDPFLGQFQPLQGLVGLAAVGGADVEHESAAHLQGLGELRLRPGGNHADDLVAQLHVHIAGKDGTQAFLADVEALLCPQEFQELRRHKLLLVLPQDCGVQAHQLVHHQVADLHDGDLVVLLEREIGQVPNLPVVLLQMGLAYLAVLRLLHLGQQPVDALHVSLLSLIVLLFYIFGAVPVLGKIELR